MRTIQASDGIGTVKLLVVTQEAFKGILWNNDRDFEISEDTALRLGTEKNQELAIMYKDGHEYMKFGYSIVTGMEACYLRLSSRRA